MVADGALVRMTAIGLDCDCPVQNLNGKVNDVQQDLIGVVQLAKIKKF